MSSPTEKHPHRHEVPDPFAAPDVYYGQHPSATSNDPKRRHFSAQLDRSTLPFHDVVKQHRRGSQDAAGEKPRQFLVPVEATLKELLEQEDTDKKGQITVEDHGPKVLNIGTAGSQGIHRVDIRGTYVLSSLLQELTLAKDYGLKEVLLDEQRLNENPVDRLNRFIRDIFWPNLTRCIDGANIGMVAKDPKDWTSDPRPRVYVPPGASEQFEYYSEIARKHPDLRLDVRWLSANVTPEYIRDLNDAPGLLAVAMDKHTKPDGATELKGKPFLVPGGRFNELYGWDSYMSSLGLLLHNRVDLCKSIVENFCFCIEYYGKILNANRTYYLGRSQPPFLTDMTLRVYDRIRHQPDSLEFLRLGMLAAMKEYYTVWVASPRFDKKTGLSRYRPEGVGVPPETESTHFKHVLDPYAKKHGITFKEFVEKYNHGIIKEPDLDVYFTHDRAVRESGHDTSYRLESVAADVATVDLNSCLYKIECDIARTLRGAFDGRLAVPSAFHVKGMSPDAVETAAQWDRRAKMRRLAMDRYMWDEENGMYFDYNTAKEKVTGYESVTTFWAMWAGVATPRQAAAMVIKALPKFEEMGGLASGTEQSRGAVGLHRPNRQWDYPFGWAPQQILAWTGLERYGYMDEAKRLAYKWLYMVVNAFHNFNGVVVEKYDVTRPDKPHDVAAEYGNQGLDFKGVPREGFGWVNASFVVALDIVDAHQRRALENLTPWDTYEAATRDLAIDVFEDDKAPESEHLSKPRSRTGLAHEGIPKGEPIHSKGMGHLAHSHTDSARHDTPAHHGGSNAHEQAPPSSAVHAPHASVQHAEPAHRDDTALHLTAPPIEPSHHGNNAPLEHKTAESS